MTTHVFGDIATATRIESTAKTMSVSSTLTTVAQKARQAQPRRRRLDGPALLGAAAVPAEEVLVRQVEQVQPPTSFTQASAIRWTASSVARMRNANAPTMP